MRFIPWILTLFAFTAFAGEGVPRGGASEYEEENTTWVYPTFKHSWIVIANQAHLALYTFGKAKFVNPQGLDAVRLSFTDDPDDRGDDDEISVYGVNSGQNSIIYNSSMTSISLYGYDETGEARLDAPWDVAATPEGLVFVTDSGNRRVVKLRFAGDHLAFEGSFGDRAPASLVLPRGIDVTAGGEVVVADAGSGRIIRFDTTGAFLGEIGGFDRPTGLAAVDREDTTVRPRDEYIVVVDSAGKRLNKLRFDGSMIKRIDIAQAVGCEKVNVGHVDIELYHNVITTDSLNHRLYKFDSALSHLASWGRKGKGRAKFTGPTGLTVWRWFGQTFVADQRGAHYLWVGTDLVEEPEIRVEPDGSRIRVKLFLTEKSRITLQLVDDDGNVVREKKLRRMPGRQSIDWVLKAEEAVFFHDRSGIRKTRSEPLRPGEYRLLIRMRAEYSSRKTFENVLETRVSIPSGG